MSTKDCIVALNARLDARSAPYDGNRKFKRVSKKKNEQGRVVRVFRDDRHTFVLTGEGPYEIQLELDAGAPVPAFAKAPQTHNAPVSTPAPAPRSVIGYFQEDEGQFTLVLKDYWDEEGSVDPAADFEDLLPPDFFNLADATFEYDGEIDDGAAVLIAAGFQRKALSEPEPEASSPRSSPSP